MLSRSAPWPPNPKLHRTPCTTTTSTVKEHVADLVAMLSLDSRPWPSGRDKQEHPPRQIRPSSLPTPKYFPVTECVTRNQPDSTWATADVNHQKHTDTSFRTSAYMLYSTSARPQYHTHWSLRRRSSRPAPFKAFISHKHRSTTHKRRTPQSQHRHSPATRYISIQNRSLPFT